MINLVIIRLAEELKTIKPDYNKMASKLADAKKNLEDETLKRIDLQNQLQTMQEEHKFENSILEQQLNETRTRKQIEIEEVDSRVSTEYEQKLHPVLQLLQADQHHGVVRIAGHTVLQLEERTVFGEENLLPVLTARLIQGLNAMLDPGGRISVN